MEAPQQTTQEQQPPAAEETKAKKAKPVKVKKPIQTSGRRKQAIARAVLSAGKGVIRLNSHLLSSVTPQLTQDRIMEPILLAGSIAHEVNIDVDVHGGGLHGQAEAARLAIGKALALYNKKLKKVFLDYDRHLLVADVRFKEQRKPNDSKARAARQKSYR